MSKGINYNYTIEEMPYPSSNIKKYTIKLQHGALIIKNYDTFEYTSFLTGKKLKSTKCKWYVMGNIDDSSVHQCTKYTRVFDKHTDAVSYARRKYLEYCLGEVRNVTKDIKYMQKQLD